MLGTNRLTEVDRMTTVEISQFYVSSTGHSLILLNLSEAYQLPPIDSGIVNNTAR